tara:strand:- start:127 stop:660 length:534 start_codon:yes stop_codon:yes gene_type:complete
MGQANTKGERQKNVSMKSGRREFYDFLHTNPERANGPVLHTAEGKEKKVDIFQDTVVAYQTPSKIDLMQKFHEDARSNGLQGVLNPIIHTGKHFVIHPRCEEVTQSNLPKNYKEDLDLLGGLQKIGFWDYHKGNIMLCQGHLKIVDQNTSTDPEAHSAARKFKKFTSDIEMLNKKKD